MPVVAVVVALVVVVAAVLIAFVASLLVQLAAAAAAAVVVVVAVLVLVIDCDIFDLWVMLMLPHSKKLLLRFLDLSSAAKLGIHLWTSLQSNMLSQFLIRMFLS